LKVVHKLSFAQAMHPTRRSPPHSIIISSFKLQVILSFIFVDHDIVAYRLNKMVLSCIGARGSYGAAVSCSLALVEHVLQI
jgi:hypothetical protein